MWLKISLLLSQHADRYRPFSIPLLHKIIHHILRSYSSSCRLLFKGQDLGKWSGFGWVTGMFRVFITNALSDWHFRTLSIARQDDLNNLLFFITVHFNVFCSSDASEWQMKHGKLGVIVTISFRRSNKSEHMVAARLMSSGCLRFDHTHHEINILPTV